jgi:hypothetical protein
LPHLVFLYAGKKRKEEEIKYVPKESKMKNLVCSPNTGGGNYWEVVLNLTSTIKLLSEENIKIIILD